MSRVPIPLKNDNTDPIICVFNTTVSCKKTFIVFLHVSSECNEVVERKKLKWI